MQTKTSTILISGCVVLVLLAGAFAGGVFVGWALPRTDAQAPLTQGVIPSATIPFPVPITSTPAPSIGTPARPQPGVTTTPQATSTPDLQTLFKPFWQAWNLVHQEYVNQPVDDNDLMRGAISGMLNSLGDPHTSYSDPTVFQQQMSQLNGSQYEGIGAWVDTTGSYMKIISPMPDSPAFKAGLKPGDLVLAVDKQDVTGLSGTEVLQKVLGPAGSIVTLTIQRGTAKPFDVTIQRAKITVPQAEWHMEKNNIAYVHLFIFGDQTAGQLQQALQELLPQKPQGFILDLRYNGGGYLTTAIDVLSQFVPGGKIVMYEQYGNGQKISYKSRGGGLAADGSLPIVVLVDEGTASASEITAGALQDLGLAKLVGVKTYGKGSVQQLTTLDGNQGGVRITIAHWLTPNGRLIDGLGLTPDYEVKITADDTSAGRDPQLQKAIDLLSAK
jgi:carboxyl-terminal processing protease